MGEGDAGKTPSVAGMEPNDDNNKWETSKDLKIRRLSEAHECRRKWGGIEYFLGMGLGRK